MTSCSVVSLAIACASDSRYALPLAVMLRSLLANLASPCQVDIYAVDDGIGSADKAKVGESLSNHATLHWVERRRSTLSSLPTWGRMPVTTYQKLAVGEWLPDHVEKVIWLDCDLLVLDDITPLWNTDLAGRHVLAVKDQRVARVSSRFGVAGYHELGLAPEAGYFNAGVLLIDVAKWRRDDVAGRAIDYLNSYRKRVFFWDQEALNAVLAGKWGELPSGWNWNPTLNHFITRPPANGRNEQGRNRAPDKFPDEIRIAHFSGNLKPWECCGSSPHHHLYFQYLNHHSGRGWGRPGAGEEWRRRPMSCPACAVLPIPPSSGQLS